MSQNRKGVSAAAIIQGGHEGSGVGELTRDISDFICHRKLAHLSDREVTIAKQCLLDYIGVAIAGCQQPPVKVVRSLHLQEEGAPQASVIASDCRVSVRAAARIHGTMAHALDYDDVLPVMSGHATVPVASALLGLAEYEHRSGAELILAFVTGVDVACVIGQFVGESHYENGFHSTATLGIFGAAAGCAKLQGLDNSEVIAVLAVAATFSAGLKCSFATMGKPLQVGQAASNGLLAAQLAHAGIAGPLAPLEDPQGFAATHSNDVSIQRAKSALERTSFISDTLFKFHVTCFLTYSMIEAVLMIKKQQLIELDSIHSIEVFVNENCLSVCNIKNPRSGDEAKFSLRFICAMVLVGLDTSKPDTFSDEIVSDPKLLKLSNIVVVKPFDTPQKSTMVKLKFNNGHCLSQSYDAAVPERDVSLQSEKLKAKFSSLASSSMGKNRLVEIGDMVDQLETLDDIAPMMKLVSKIR